MFNLDCTVLTGHNTLSEPEDFSSEVVLPYFTDACDIPARVLRIPKQFRRFVIVIESQSTIGASARSRF
jgi:hypothetical protein